MLAAMEVESRPKTAGIHCGKTADMEANADFTTPEAQEKAKVVQQALKSTKGAPEHIRKASVKVTAEKLKQASVEKYLKD
jgi:hypothetical protein